MKSRNGTKVLVLILIFLSILLIGSWIFFLMKPSTSNSTASPDMALNSSLNNSIVNNSLWEGSSSINSSAENYNQSMNNSVSGQGEETVPEIQIPSSKILNVVASNNPGDYLGEYIGYESPSDWKNYQPLIDKVNQLTAGLSTDREKAYAIGNWVMHSREYNLSLSVQMANPTNWTIIDLFNEEGGVCLDSAYLTVAMLRLAGIPARAVSPASGGYGHEQTEVYIDGQWYTMDSTYGSGDLYFPTQPDDLLRYVDGYAGYYGPEDTYYFIGYSVEKNNSGFIEYPIVSQEASKEWYSQLGGTDVIQGDIIICNMKQNGNPIFSFGYYRVAAKYFVEGFRNKTETFSPPTGFLKGALPPGEYELECAAPGGLFGSQGSYKIAFADFNITSGKTTVILPEDFNKESTATPESFSDFISLVNQSMK